MILRELHIERYGGLSDHGPLRFNSGLNLITGPNESGKTTLMEAVTTVLFGYAPARYDRHPRAPWDQAPLGIRAVVEVDREPYRVERRLGQEVFGLLHGPGGSEEIDNRPLPGIELSFRHYGHLYALKQGDLPDLGEEVVRSLEDRLLFDRTAHLFRTPGELAEEAEATLHGIWRPHNRGKYALKSLREKKRDLLERKRKLLLDEKALRQDHGRLEELGERREQLRFEITEEKKRIEASTRALDRKQRLAEINDLEKRLREAASLEGLTPASYDQMIERTEELEALDQQLLQLKVQAEEKGEAIRRLEEGLPSVETRARISFLERETIRATERWRMQQEESEAAGKKWREACQGEPHLRVEALDKISWPDFKGALLRHEDLTARREEGEKQLQDLRVELPSRRIGLALLTLFAVLALGGYVIERQVLWLVFSLVFSLLALLFHQRVYVPLRLKVQRARRELDRWTDAHEQHRRRLAEQLTALGLSLEKTERIVERLAPVFGLRASWLAAEETERRGQETLERLKEELLALGGGRSAEVLEEENRRLELLKAERDALVLRGDQTQERINTVAADRDRLLGRLTAFDPDPLLAKEKIEHYFQMRSRLFFLKEGYEEIAVEHLGYACYDTEAAIEEARESLARVEEERDQVIEEASGLRMRLDLASAETQLPELLSRIDALDREMEVAKVEKKDLQLEIAMLRYIDEVYKHEHQPPILKLASEHLFNITGGRYLRLSFDAYQLVVESEAGDRIPVDRGLSQGTVDQIFFAFRMAAMQHYDRHFGPLPVLLDDVFAHWDEERFVAFLPALEAMAKDRQVLLLTHHRAQREQLHAYFDQLDEIQMR